MKRSWTEIHVDSYYERISVNVIVIKNWPGLCPGHEYRYRIIDIPRDDSGLMMIAPEGWRFWRGLVMYRSLQSLRLAGKFIVVLLSVWGLADWDPCAVPVWECIRPLRWLKGAACSVDEARRVK